MDCPEHGVLQVNVPWAESSAFHPLMERLIIDVLTECASLTGARRILRITWSVMGAMGAKRQGTQAVTASTISWR